MTETVLIKVDEIKVKTTKFRIAATKIAKRLDISMFYCTEKLIEIVEADKSKASEFVKAISKLNKKTKIIDLVQSNQDKDAKGNMIGNSKAKYLADDKHYKELIGELHPEQIVEQIGVF